MTQLIDPLYDIGFKLLLGRENVSEELLMDFLNAVFAGDPVLSNITSVRYMNNERAGEWDKAKGIRYDIMCQTSEGHKFIVEMQKASQRNFVKRGGYYVCRAIAEQGHKGKEEDTVTWEYEITPVIGVFLCNFHVNSLPPKTLTKVRMMDEETKEPVGDFMRLIFIQLPSFRKEESECDTIFDKWIYNLKNMGHTQTVAFQTNNEIFQRLAKIGNLSSLSPEERRNYEADVKIARDRHNQLKYAWETGMEEGRAKGMQEGRAEGRAEGIQLGKIMTARTLKALDYSDAEIQTITGLDPDIIRDL